jgi:phosphomannomutase
MGGEESGGITIKGHVPMGDGILMGLLLIEMMSYYGRSLRALAQELRDELGEFYYARRDLRTKPFAKSELVSRLKNDPPARLAGLNLVSINDRDGVKYLFDDDSWLLIRPSGTEPVLRVYSEARSPQLVEALLTQGVALSDAMRNGA